MLRNASNRQLYSSMQVTQICLWCAGSSVLAVRSDLHMAEQVFPTRQTAKPAVHHGDLMNKVESASVT